MIHTLLIALSIFVQYDTTLTPYWQKSPTVRVYAYDRHIPVADETVFYVNFKVLKATDSGMRYMPQRDTEVHIYHSEHIQYVGLPEGAKIDYMFEAVRQALGN